MAIGQAERWGLVARNVASLTDGPRLERSEGRTLTVEQAKKLLEAAQGDRLEACYVTLLALVVGITERSPDSITEIPQVLSGAGGLG